MRALPGVSLIEVLVALATTATLLSLLMSFPFQVQIGQRVLDKIDPTQNTVQRNLVPFLTARLEEVALVQNSIDQSAVEFELTRHTLSFVSRVLPHSPYVGLQKVSVRNLGGGQTGVSLSDWPEAVNEESMLFSGVAVEFRADYSGSIFPELPSTVLMISGDQEFRMLLGSSVPINCVFPITGPSYVYRCGELNK